MNRIAVSTLSKLVEDGTHRNLLHCSIKANTSTGVGLLNAVQNKLRYVRTDLDKFNDVEIALLIDHGKNVATAALDEAYGQVVRKSGENAHSEDSRSISSEEAIRSLNKSSSRRWRLFSWGDSASYVLAGSAVGVVFTLYYLLITLPRFEAERTQKALQATSDDVITTINRLNEQRARFEAQINEFRARLEAADNASKSSPKAPVACRIPSNGIERYDRTEAVTQSSGWMGGGHTQGEWCNTLVATLRPRYPQNSQFKVNGSSESSRSACSPFNCPQYNYTCNIQVQSDPIYKEAVNPDCPR
jgi:hypothetical protein